MKTNRMVLLMSMCVVIGCAKETVTAPEAVATKMEAASPVFVQGIVASTVTNRPSVIVRDQHGNPIPGVRVIFVPMYEVGTLSGTDVVTDASGRATLGGWSLSKKAGLNRITAIAGSLSVEFSGTGIAGPAATLTKAGGDDQFAFPGATLATPQAVLVRDVYENPVANTLVTFAVTGGDGSLQATTALSDGDGIAQISGWTLGSSGVQSLTATAEGLASVTFTATIPDNPCAPLSLAPGTAGQSMDVEAFSCALPDGRRANFFALNVTTAGVYDLSSESSTFRNTVTLATSSGTSVGEGSASPSLSTRFRAYLEKGQYMMRVASSLPADRGSYRISVVSTLDPTRGCQDTFLSIGSRISEVLEAGDCEFGRGLFADQYRVFVAAGSQLTVTMGSVEVDNVISVMDPDGDFVTGTNASSLEGGVYGARVGFTALKTGYYLVIATTAYSPGPYSLNVQSLK